MKSEVKQGLTELNSRLRASSWDTFQKLIVTVLKSNPVDETDVILAHIERGAWTEVLDWADGLVSTVYRTPREHRVYHQFAAIIRKYPFPPGVLIRDPEGAALAKFHSAEHRCRRVNQRFLCYRKVRSPHERVLSRARDYVSYVLGGFSLSEVWDNAGFGAGASLGVHGNCTNLARKLLSREWTVTPGAYYYASAALKTDMHLLELLNKEPGKEQYSVDQDLFNKRFREKAKLVGHNKISFVPKDATTHRVIATEPLLNGYLQKGVDEVMRKRLLRVGIDLKNQSHNQKLARKGSLMGDDAGWATIDLSSASDSVSTELCRFLLPPDWFDFLNSVRSHAYSLNGNISAYHKFVSMGNGFCFPLETLIFASLVHACHNDADSFDRFLVYGDDIIVESHVFQPLIELLTICGFKVNPKKTFAKGPFRESCGADWFKGEDVRPIILDYPLDSWEAFAKFCNGCRSKESWNAFFGEAQVMLHALIPSDRKLVRPWVGNPDSAFEVPFDAFMSSPFSRYSRKTRTWSWLEAQKQAVPDNSVRSHASYDVALIAGVMRGAQSSCPFSERFTSRTKLKRTTSNGALCTWDPLKQELWDLSPNAVLQCRLLERRRPYQ